MSSRFSRPRRGYPPGATALRPRRGIYFLPGRQGVALFCRRRSAWKRPDGSIRCTARGTRLCTVNQAVSQRRGKSCLRPSWALASGRSRILLPPAPISVVIRVYGISLGGSGTDRSETCPTGAGRDARAPRARHRDNESCDPSSRPAHVRSWPRSIAPARSRRPARAGKASAGTLPRRRQVTAARFPFAAAKCSWASCQAQGGTVPVAIALRRGNGAAAADRPGLDSATYGASSEPCRRHDSTDIRIVAARCPWPVLQHVARCTTITRRDILV